MNIIQYVNEHGSKLFSLVTLTNPGDFLAGSATEIALKDWITYGDSSVKLCYAWWPRAQIGAFVYYPADHDAPSESQLFETARMHFITQNVDDWKNA